MTAHTLILSCSMQPHRVATWEEAICLLYTGKVEVLAEYDEEVSSPSVTMKIPAVVRLTKKTTSIKRNVKFSRVNVYTRDDFRCAYCGEKKGACDLTYDHVVPRSRGGRTDFENIVAACRPCNRKKGDRTPEQAGMPLRRRPHRPATLPVARLVVRQHTPEAWAPFFGEVG
jgi:5-methylcytosine-specific restriction endonuclease McrA